MASGAAACASGCAVRAAVGAQARARRDVGESRERACHARVRHVACTPKIATTCRFCIADGIRYPGVTDFDASHCLARGVLRLPRGGIARFLSSYDQLECRDCFFHATTKSPSGVVSNFPVYWERHLAVACRAIIVYGDCECRRVLHSSNYKPYNKELAHSEKLIVPL